MRPWLTDNFANPHSSHRLGREAAAAVELAREQVLRALSLTLEPAAASQGVSTPARSERFTALHLRRDRSAELGLKGALTRLPPERRRIVVLATEHAAVLDTAEWLGRMGAAVDILPVGADGLVDLASAAERITEHTGIVAAMLVNNEIGVIQPVAALAQLARASGALFLCDAVQGFGRVPVPLDACDLVALSAHKVHGPRASAPCGSATVSSSTPCSMAAARRAGCARAPCRRPCAPASAPPPAS
jgi:cysteine desulfurase